MSDSVGHVAILDYGLGNLFSVQQACRHVGLDGIITDSAEDILAADAVILPGVGAYEDAMRELHRRDLVAVLRDVAASDKPLFGICLGMQLLMSVSYEFGEHQGLGIVPGEVVHFDHMTQQVGIAEHRITKTLKVPQVGWNHIRASTAWEDTPLQNVRDNEYMYFVHSYYVVPQSSEWTLSTTCYGDVVFCSSFKYGNIFACQFHPERSGVQGLQIYKNLAEMIH